MKKNLIELICIVDMSGSMSKHEEAAIEGFEGFINEQKTKNKEIKTSLTFFDHRYIEVVDNIDIKEFKTLKEYGYYPFGTTALQDAIGKTINKVGNRLSNTKEEEKPEKVIVCIQTDGLENASTEYTDKQIREMIKHQQNKYNWKFLFLGEGLKKDVEITSKGLGIARSINYDNSDLGYQKAYVTTSSVVDCLMNDDE